MPPRRYIALISTLVFFVVFVILQQAYPKLSASAQT
jgi:hypothetical protein